jgi:hypothetical protein
MLLQQQGWLQWWRRHDHCHYCNQQHHYCHHHAAPVRRGKAMPEVLGTLDSVLTGREWLEGEFGVSDVAVGSYLLYLTAFFPDVRVWPLMAVRCRFLFPAHLCLFFMLGLSCASALSAALLTAAAASQFFIAVAARLYCPRPSCQFVLLPQPTDGPFGLSQRGRVHEAVSALTRCNNSGTAWRRGAAPPEIKRPAHCRLTYTSS